jgi:hypothetical protein
MYTAVGISGALLVLFGFYRITTGKWSGKSILYELDNLIGAILIGIYQFHNRVYITVILNVIWAVVALRGIASYSQRRRKNRR